MTSRGRPRGRPGLRPAPRPAIRGEHYLGEFELAIPPVFEFPFLFLFLPVPVVRVSSPVPVDVAFALAPPPLGVLDLLRLQAPRETARQTTITSKSAVNNFRMVCPPIINWFIILWVCSSGTSQAFMDSNLQLLFANHKHILPEPPQRHSGNCSCLGSGSQKLAMRPSA